MRTVCVDSARANECREAFHAYCPRLVPKAPTGGSKRIPVFPQLFASPLGWQKVRRGEFGDPLHPWQRTQPGATRREVLRTSFGNTCINAIPLMAELVPSNNIIRYHQTTSFDTMFVTIQPFPMA